MKIAIENFGAIKKRIEIEPKPLTIFCGSNNTGKTYCLYVLNALMDSRFIASFDWAKHNAKTLLEQRSMLIDCSALLRAESIKQAQNNIAYALKASLARFFVAESGLIDEATLEISLSLTEIEAQLSNFDYGYGEREGIHQKAPMIMTFKVSADGQSIDVQLRGDWTSSAQVERALNNALMELYCPIRQGRALLLPAERTGINLFFRELNSRRAALLRHVTSQTLDTNELLKDIIVSRYPQPIHDYIEFMNSQPEIKRQTSEKFADLATWLQKEVLRVKYKVDRYGDISIAPLRSKTELGLHLGSSTAKTFFGLWSYLNHLAQPGDCLMIDEPELNLHPLNQRNIARLLAELVNRGIRVVVSTHSDYMVREWGNLVMLSEDFPERDALSKRHGLRSSQWLSADKVHAYEFHSGGVEAMSIEVGSGIRTPLFDESIEQLNAAAQDIYFAVQEARPAEPEQKAVKVRKGKA
jgi:predicted ATP-dependent endonuclease of OLD family